MLAWSAPMRLSAFTSPKRAAAASAPPPPPPPPPDRDHVRPVSASHLVRSLAELLRPERANRAEVGVADVLAAALHSQQRLVSQRLQGVEHVRSAQVEHRLRRVEGEAPGEHRRLRQGCALRGVEQRPRPLDRAAHRGLSRARPPSFAAKDVEGRVEALVQAVESEHVESRGGELDGQRQALELLHDGFDSRSRTVVELELRPARAGSIREELGGDADRQGRDLTSHFTVDPQPLSRGGEQAGLRGVSEQRGDDARGRINHLLDAVENQQRSVTTGEGAPEVRGSGVLVAVGAEADPQRCGEGRGELVGGVCFGTDTEDRVAAAVGVACGEPPGHARFADARGTPERDQAIPACEDPVYPGDVRVTPHEASWRFQGRHGPRRRLAQNPVARGNRPGCDKMPVPGRWTDL